MSQYQLYGIGNALVDIDISVSEQFLVDANIDKGVMTLIDEHAHHQLLDKISGLDQAHNCGGSAANTLITFSQLGGQGFYSCKVANDAAGDRFVTDMQGHGLATNLNSQLHDAGVTGKCIVMVTPDAQRTMMTHLGITETLSVIEVDAEAIKNSQYVYLEGYLVTSPTGRAAAIKVREVAQAANVKTSITLSDPNMVKFFKEGLIEMIGDKVDLLFCNEDEACLFSGDNDVNGALNYLNQYANHIVVTRGAKGALLSIDKVVSEVATTAVTPVDTVGAGDVFAGSYLYAITHGHDPISATELANRAASQIVQIHSPRLTEQQIQKL